MGHVKTLVGIIHRLRIYTLTLSLATMTANDMEHTKMEEVNNNNSHNGSGRDKPMPAVDERQVKKN